MKEKWRYICIYIWYIYCLCTLLHRERSFFGGEASSGVPCKLNALVLLPYFVAQVLEATSRAGAFQEAAAASAAASAGQLQQHMALSSTLNAGMSMSAEQLKARLVEKVCAVKNQVLLTHEREQRARANYHADCLSVSV